MSQLLRTSLNNITNEINDYIKYKNNYDCLLTLPIFKDILKENQKIKKSNKDLINIINLLNNINNNTSTNNSNSNSNKTNKKKLKKLRKNKCVDSVFQIIENNVKPNIVYEIIDDEYVFDIDNIKLETLSTVSATTPPCFQKEDNNIKFVKKMKIKKEVISIDDEEEVEEDEHEEEVEVEEDEQEVEVEEDEQEVEEVDEQEEVEVDEQEEVEEDEQEVEEDEQEVEEVEEVEEIEEEEEEVKEVKINGKTYYITNEINGIIYDLDENDEISLEVGKYNNGVPTFY